MKVHFSNVGKDRKTWSTEVASLSDLSLTSEIRRRNALCSRDIDFSWSDDGTSADIYVGVFRCVGSLQVEGGTRA